MVVAEVHRSGGSDEEDGSLPPLNSARNLEDAPPHRVDPALRGALEKLDAVTRRKPEVDDFAIEHYFGPGPPGSDTPPPPPSNSQAGSNRGARAAGGLRPCFSTDMLFAALGGPASAAPSEPPTPSTSIAAGRGSGRSNTVDLTGLERFVAFNATYNTETSRSTSPGSTAQLAFSAGSSQFEGLGASAEITGGAAAPVAHGSGSIASQPSPRGPPAGATQQAPQARSAQNNLSSQGRSQPPPLPPRAGGPATGGSRGALAAGPPVVPPLESHVTPSPRGPGPRPRPSSAGRRIRVAAEGTDYELALRSAR